MQRAAAVSLVIAFSLLGSAAARADSLTPKKPSPRVAAEKRKASQRTPARPEVKDGEAEARLIEIYKLAGQAKGREALAKAERLVQDHPNFQLAQLVYGDLLTARSRPLRALGDVPTARPKPAPACWASCARSPCCA